MIPRLQVTDVRRLYEQAAADNALVEIELDTQQLRALTEEEAAQVRLLFDNAASDPQTGVQASADPQFNDSLEALLRLSWPVWKANS